MALAGKPATEDGPVAQIIRKMGAILYVKTNVPQSMMVCLQQLEMYVGEDVLGMLWLMW